ncbi:MAG TPA: hypothetical protein VND92_10005, partial [Vicinamibacterales bacterium]|nr:hypothetical protein [Vicinamibacterales bacterium]
MNDQTPPPSPPLRTTGRLVRRAVRIGLTVVGLVCIVALVGLQTPWVKDQIRDGIVSLGNRYLNGRLTIGRVDGNLLTGIALHDLVIALDGQPAIAIRRITVHYRIASLVSAGRIIDEVDVDAPDVHLRHTAAGWNLGHLIRSAPGGAPRAAPTFGISHIVVSGGRLHID